MRSGQSESHVPPVPIMTRELSSRLSDQRQILNTHRLVKLKHARQHELTVNATCRFTSGLLGIDHSGCPFLLLFVFICSGKRLASICIYNCYVLVVYAVQFSTYLVFKWPVYDIQIEVIHSEIPYCLFTCFSNITRVMFVVP